MRLPDFARQDAVDWVDEHLGHLTLEGRGDIAASERFAGGQQAADAALALYHVSGYARTRNDVWPQSRRGASALSPYIRHGLITLPQVWAHVADGPSRDRSKFRDELLWQEYARHVHARIGPDLGRPLRGQPAETADWADPWRRDMRCVQFCLDELERDGWLVNQTRMWMASQWTVRGGAPWREGEDRFFAHLLDGSRAANRVGWQWVVGSATRRPYGFSRRQVLKRAPGLCGECALRDACPIEDWPDAPPPPRVDPPDLLRADPDPDATAGPADPVIDGDPEAVWLTAESLGDTDPALAAWPDLPAVFVFDAGLLERWRLSGKRLVFLAQTLAEIGARRPLELSLGDPVETLAGRRLAATFTPVPGWRRRAARLDIVATHPWPWLSRPHANSATSFSAWRKKVRTPGRASTGAGRPAAEEPPRLF